MPYTNVPWSVTGNVTEDEEIDGTENGAIEQARYFDTTNGYTSAISTLCYGVQWDAVMNFIDSKYITEAEAIGKPSCDEISYVRDSTGQGNYSDSDNTNNLENTGLYVKNNIYDLAGNVLEWTMEFYKDTNNNRVRRGGYYDNSGSYFPSSGRSSSIPNNPRLDVGFRITLYL